MSSGMDSRNFEAFAPDVDTQAAQARFEPDFEAQAANTRPKTPETIKSHAADYKDRSWEDYSFQELGMWVHLFAKRAEHRVNPVKLSKDLTDAQNYLNMMQSKLDALFPHIKRADRLPVPLP